VSVPDGRLGVEGRPGVADSPSVTRRRRGRLHGQYGRYQAIASRRIPLVILEPA
jgi:hypothetical protein